MSVSAIYEPGEKGRRHENFPVASYIIAKEYRPAVLAFYRFARAADDVADHPGLPEKEKIARLDLFEATLRGKSDVITEALPLRDILFKRNLSSRHALDLLVAFRQDASKARYENWDDLMRYCMVSAAPVGRFVLDVHGEDASLWPASDALCSALQIINHLQDCQADYLRLNRVYIPEDTLALHGAAVTALGEKRASPALRACLTELAEKTRALLLSGALSAPIKNRRLALEVVAIEMLASRLIELLRTRDPLSERVHLTKFQSFSVMMKAALAFSRSRLLR